MGFKLKGKKGATEKKQQIEQLQNLNYQPPTSQNNESQVNIFDQQKIQTNQNCQNFQNDSAYNQFSLQLVPQSTSITKQQIQSSYSSFRKQGTIKFKLNHGDNTESINRAENWNLFSEDALYKMNFYFGFQIQFTNQLYEKYLHDQVLGSVRLLLIFLTVNSMLKNNSCYEDTECSSINTERFFTLFYGSISMLATLPYFQYHNAYLKTIAYNSIGLHISFQILVLYNQQNAYFLALLFFLPCFLINQFILPTWIQYMMFSIFQIVILSLILLIFQINPSFEFYDFINLAYKNWMFYLTVFALFEKAKKQSFINQVTTNKTKQILFNVFNQQQQNPVAIVNSKGNVQFNNDQFDYMMKNILNYKKMPKTILNLVSEDEDAKMKLRCLLDIIKVKEKSQINTSIISSDNTKLNQFKFKIMHSKQVKIKIKKQQKQGLLKFKASKKTVQEQEGEQEDQNQQCLFQNYEIYVIKGEIISYKSVKCMALTFNRISEQHAKYNLMIAHSEIIQKQLQDFSTKLEQFQYQFQDQECIIECLGNTYSAINQVQQIEQEIATDYDTEQKDLYSDFLLKEEIMFCLELMSVNCLSRKAILNLKTSQSIHDKLVMGGNKKKFCLSLQCLAEFSMKYCQDSTIDILVDVEKNRSDKKLEIKLSFTMTKQSSVNPESRIIDQALQEILNESHHNPSSNQMDYLLMKYPQIYQFVQKFGIGMILFPKLVKQLNGSYTLEIKENQNTLEENKINDQDSAVPLGRIKIIYRVPLEYSDNSNCSEVLSPYTTRRIPKNSMTQTGTTIIKSPLIGRRDLRQQEQYPVTSNRDMRVLNFDMDNNCDFQGAIQSIQQQNVQKKGMMTHGSNRNILDNFCLNSKDKEEKAQFNQSIQSKQQAEIIKKELKNIEKNSSVLLNANQHRSNNSSQIDMSFMQKPKEQKANILKIDTNKKNIKKNSNNFEQINQKSPFFKKEDMNNDIDLQQIQNQYENKDIIQAKQFEVEIIDIDRINFEGQENFSHQMISEVDYNSNVKIDNIRQLEDYEESKSMYNAQSLLSQNKHTKSLQNYSDIEQSGTYLYMPLCKQINQGIFNNTCFSASKNLLNKTRNSNQANSLNNSQSILTHKQKQYYLDQAFGQQMNSSQQLSLNSTQQYNINQCQNCKNYQMQLFIMDTKNQHQQRYWDEDYQLKNINNSINELKKMISSQNLHPFSLNDLTILPGAYAKGLAMFQQQTNKN